MQNKNLTIKELRFVEEYLKNGFNGSKAYRIAYGTSSSDVSKAEAYKLLKNPKIQDVISISEKSYKQLAREMELDREKILVELKNIIRGEDRLAKDKLAGINTLCKLIGDFSPTKQEIVFENNDLGNVDISKLSKEEREDLRSKILREMQ